MAVPIGAIVALADILARVGTGIASQVKTPYDKELSDFKGYLAKKQAELEGTPGLSGQEAAYYQGKLLDPVLAALEENQAQGEATLAAMGATTGADVAAVEDAKAEYIKEAVGEAAQKLQGIDIDFTKADEAKAMDLAREQMAVGRAEEQRRGDRQQALMSAITGATGAASDWAAEPENIASLRDAFKSRQSKIDADTTASVEKAIAGMQSPDYGGIEADIAKAASATTLPSMPSLGDEWSYGDLKQQMGNDEKILSLMQAGLSREAAQRVLDEGIWGATN
tara:strand:- start:201 stop:1043 length:843 start_codon:yes stop_codon:yes gene_type:complete